MRSHQYMTSTLALVFLVTLTLVQAIGQSGNTRQRVTEKPDATTTQEPKKPDAPTKGLSEEQIQGLRRQSTSEEEAADVSYLRNYIEEYRLGPEDVIGIEVFNLPQYSVPQLIIPPDGKVNYKLIGYINVRGRTVESVQKEIAEKLNEYIIDPKVNVQLLQSHSMKYMVDGDVGKPGIFEMTRRMTIREAIVNSGGILPTGDRAKVQIARALPNGQTSVIPVNFKELEKGRGVDEFLAPGDVIFVPGNRFKTISKYLQIVQTVTWLPMIIGAGRRF
ncbi:MAG TPA: polysaccharide biosynthesis/export family protein [Blastocatellia bacterium]|nr:polysaccharide biosynthesis/export family protein [Blastocatellia bacterium]